ncbi:MAG: DUF348 domain-containing protein, partial [bacterium]|nr:DUF348 domain-containing protein [bacterium]
METTATISSKRLYLPQSIKAIAALILVVSTLAAGYQTTLTPVSLIIDGQPQQLHTHQNTVAALLMDIGLTLYAQDIVTPALDTALEPGLTVEVRQARTVHISADGHDVVLRTHAASVEAVLDEAKLSLLPHDEIEVTGEFTSAGAGRTALEPVRITLHRAVPFTLH